MERRAGYGSAAPGGVFELTISPAHTFIAFTTTNAPHHNDSWIAPLDTPEKIASRSGARPPPRLQASAGGGSEPVWAAGGRELFYRTPTHLMSATLALGANLSVARR